MAVYYATKAFVLSFSEAVAEETIGTGVTVSALCPGATATNFAAAAGARTSAFFDRTAMTAASVAEAGHRGFRRGKVVSIAGFKNQMLAFAVRLGPRALVRKIVRRLNDASYARE